jgi:hypothetical protein
MANTIDEVIAEFGLQGPEAGERGVLREAGHGEAD